MAYSINAVYVYRLKKTNPFFKVSLNPFKKENPSLSFLYSNFVEKSNYSIYFLDKNFILILFILCFTCTHL